MEYRDRTGSRHAFAAAAVYVAAVAMSSLVILHAMSWQVALRGPAMVPAFGLSTWVGAALWRRVYPVGSPAATLLRGAAVAAVSLVGFVILLGTGNWPMLLSLTAVTALIGVALDSLIGALGGRRDTGAVVLGLFILLVGAPIWLGPYLSGHQGLLDATIWSNPLVHLSVQAGIDLFRTDALYSVSPIGGLRYAYPRPELAMAVLFAVVLILLAVLNHLRQVDRTH